MLPAYVINLDRRPDRWATISEQCSHLGIQVTRISAVDAEGIITAGHISAGEEACLQSHCAALQEFLKTGAPAALILEDDAELSSALPKVLRSTSWWPDDARLIKLDVVKEKHRLLGRIEGTNPAGNELRRIAMAHAGAAGYLIDRAAAEFVLSAWQDMLMPIDLLLFHLVKSPYARFLKPLQAVPALVRHSGEGSDMQLRGRKRRRGSSGSVTGSLSELGFSGLGSCEYGAGGSSGRRKRLRSAFRHLGDSTSSAGLQ